MEANHLILNGNGVVGQALNNTVPPPQQQHESPVNVLTTTHLTTNPAAASIMGVKNNNNVDSDINPYLCLFFPVTAGIQGLGLGSDEEEIVLLVYILVDPETNKVVNIQQYLVKPRTADINENILSEQCLAESTLTEELVKAAMPVEVALEEFETYVRTHLLSGLRPRGLEFVTDGQLSLRQCLHPEACSKNIQLAEFYETFYDLRKEFCHFYHTSEVHSIREMVEHLEMLPNSDLEQFEFYAREVKDMLSLVLRLLADGHKFENPEIIAIRLEPGICSKNEEVDGNCVVRARGLPWQSSDQDIAKFFRGLNVAKGGVALCLSPQGRRNGEALVRFVNQEHRDMALKRHKHHIGNRYIEVYKASGEDFVNVAGGNNNEAQAFLSRGGQVIVRMRGLPYDCTAKQVLEFFDSGDNSCSVLDGEEGVLFVKKPDGRATGDAFVLFSQEEDAAVALSKHRELIGSRYIELFRSTTAEVQQVLNRSMDPKTYEQQAPLIAQLPQVPLLPQHIITSGTRKDCIRLRGLLYEAQVEHILEFLGEHAKNIVFQGVHMVYNAQGQPSGEAFIQMDSEQSAFLAAQQKHHRYMIFGKKQRYIEVFQCSGEDMNLVLTGGIPSQKAAAAAAAAALMSPGMLAAATSPGGHQPPGPPMPGSAAWEQHHPLMLQNLAALRMQAPPPSHPPPTGATAHPPPPDPLWLLGLSPQHKLQPPPQAAGASQQNFNSAAAAAVAAGGSWTDLNGNSPAPGAPPPASSASASPSGKPYPVVSASHHSPAYTPLLQAAPFPMQAASHQLPPPPLFFLNMAPRMASFAAMAAAAARQQQVAQLQQQVAAAQAHKSPGGPVSMHPNAAAAAAAAAMHQLGIKRSWEQAFPGANPAALQAAAQGIKRTWPAPGSAQYGHPGQNPATPNSLPVMYQQPPQFYPSM